MEDPMKRLLLPVLLSLGLSGLFVPQVAAEDGAIEVSAAWARPTIPTRPGAGYFVLRNTGAEADVLLSASSERAEEVQMHTVEEQNGVMNMLRLESIEIAPGGEVTFRPSGHHLMFRGLDEPLVEGETVPVTMLFEKAGEIEVEFAVGREPPGGGTHGEGGHDGDHGHGAEAQTH